MSHFYGTIKGDRGPATRRGSTQLTTQAAGWRGCIEVELRQKDMEDYYVVRLTPWQGSGGTTRILAAGKLEAATKVGSDYDVTPADLELES